MLAAAAFVPATSLLIPDVAAGAVGELDEIRTACRTAIDVVLAQHPTELVLLGVAPRTGAYPSTARIDLAGIGMTTDVVEAPSLPRALSVGRWLLEQAHAPHDVPGYDQAQDRLPVTAFGVTRDDAPARCGVLGEALAQRSARVAVLVVGDGSARRGPKAPGAFDERAHDFDRTWVDALRDVDTFALEDLDPHLADELMVEGRAPWQVVAAMASRGADGESVGDEVGDLVGDVLCTSDPYGVMYAVATWLPRPRQRDGASDQDGAS